MCLCLLDHPCRLIMLLVVRRCQQLVVPPTVILLAQQPFLLDSRLQSALPRRADFFVNSLPSRIVQILWISVMLPCITIVCHKFCQHACFSLSSLYYTFVCTPHSKNANWHHHSYMVGWLVGWLVVLVICSQMAVQIEMPLGMEVHLGHGQTLLGRGRVPQKWAFCVLWVLLIWASLTVLST